MESIRLVVVMAALALSALASRAGAFDLIHDVLPCGTTGTAGGLAAGTQMQRLDLDQVAFPDARCADGTAALFYYRPSTDPAYADRWLIQLQGGGQCSSGQACAERWCKINTSFSMLQMSSTPAPPAINGKGILDNRPANPIGEWNHVFVRYCSSDGWGGTTADVETEAELQGIEFEFRLHRLGGSIVDAVIDTLRRDGVPVLDYTLGGGTISMPDLDDAEVVVLAGASAGGNGVTLNADRVRAHLLANNTGSPDFYVLIDSRFPPELELLDVSTSRPCTEDGLCTHEAMLSGADELSELRGDESCETWHATQAPGTEWKCNSASHLIKNHITSPMFVRMGQHDKLNVNAYAGSGFAVPGQPGIDAGGFAELVRQEASALANIQTHAEEASEITTVPGVFAPTCEKHETLRSDDDIFDVTIEHGGVDLAMFDVIGNWLSGTQPSNVITPRGGADVCPGQDPFTQCPDSPAPGCREPVVAGKSLLKVVDHATDAKDLIKWTWPKGDLTDPDHFGDPVNGHPSYRLCVWDQLVTPSGNTQSVAVISATVPPGGVCNNGKPCWKATKKGFKFNDPDKANDGIKTIVLSGNATDPGKPKIVVVGKGEDLRFEEAPPLLPFLQDTRVTAQLANSDGYCWQSTYETHITNGADLFKAKGD